jgi:Tol biopolymer transport system component
MATNGSTEGKTAVTTEAMTQRSSTKGRSRKAVLVSLALGMALAAMVATAGTVRQAEAALTDTMVFVSNRTTGTGVDNPTGDYEIFTMNPDGSGAKQLTSNAGNDIEPTLSPDGTKIAYQSEGIQASNPEGDAEVYVMSALDGSAKKNLSNNGSGVGDYDPAFSPNGTKLAYESYGGQTSNPEGDAEVYSMNTVDGKSKKNLSNNGLSVHDRSAVFYPDGTKIAYVSIGIQTSNSQGDEEIYRMNALDGSAKRNLSNNGLAVDDYSLVLSPNGTRIAYTSQGKQTSNPEGDLEVYRMGALDGTGKRNLTNNGLYVHDYEADFSPNGTVVSFVSVGAQTSNPDGDKEIYRMNAVDGTGQTNLTGNDANTNDSIPVFSPDGMTVSYVSAGAQVSNPEGDFEVYRMNALDGSGQTNLTNNLATDGIFVISRR